MRKEAGFEVMDQIAITYEGTEKAEKIFAEHADEIAGEDSGHKRSETDTVRICERVEDQRREGNTRRGKTVDLCPHRVKKGYVKHDQSKNLIKKAFKKEVKE